MRICKTQKACEARGVPKTTSRGTYSNMTLCVCVSGYMYSLLFCLSLESGSTAQQYSTFPYNNTIELRFHSL